MAQVYQSHCVEISYLRASDGQFGDKPLSALEVETGKVTVLGRQVSELAHYQDQMKGIG